MQIKGNLTSMPKLADSSTPVQFVCDFVGDTETGLADLDVRVSIRDGKVSLYRFRDAVNEAVQDIEAQLSKVGLKPKLEPISEVEEAE